MFTILAAVAEMERSLIADRVKEGKRVAAAKGSKIGRPSAATRPKVVRWLPEIGAEIAAGKLSRRQAAARLGVGTAALDRLLDAA